MEAGLANRYIESRGNPHGQSKFISYKVQLHVPCSFYPKTLFCSQAEQSKTYGIRRIIPG